MYVQAPERFLLSSMVIWTRCLLLLLLHHDLIKMDEHLIQDPTLGIRLD